MPWFPKATKPIALDMLRTKKGLSFHRNTFFFFYNIKNMFLI